jgi:aminoglycoside phosphotransferase (APT) family kinase protein
VSTTAEEVDLRAAVDRALAHESGAPKVALLTRRPSAYRTSFALEEVDVVLDNGDRRQLMFKDLSRQGLHESARGAKPAFLYDPVREVTVYQTILPGAPSGTARCYAAVADERRGHYWLLLERVHGVELYQVGALAAWQAVARWLAQLHRRFQSTGWPRETASHLIQRDDAYHRRWFARARSYSRPDDAERNEALSRLGARIDAVLATTARSGQGLLHGEFYASNVLIDAETSPSRVCPVDWEMAGTGPVLLDLAALTCGWDDEGRMAIARAYHDEAGGDATISTDAFLEVLTCCDVLMALQWLGWAADWSPPPEHRRDWVAVLNRRLAATQ